MENGELKPVNWELTGAELVKCVNEQLFRQITEILAPPKHFSVAMCQSCEVCSCCGSIDTTYGVDGGKLEV